MQLIARFTIEFHSDPPDDPTADALADAFEAIDADDKLRAIAEQVAEDASVKAGYAHPMFQVQVC